MFFFDPIYLLFMLPGAALAMYAQWRVSRAFAEASQIPAQSGLSGAEAANEVMHAAGIDGVAIEPVAGQLSDHYDPSDKVLRLSEPVYAERSLAAVGVAAHEAGHAIQDARRYPLLVIRNAIVPLASFGSQAAMLILMGGFLLAFLHYFLVAKWLVYAGIALFAVVVGFQVVNLPVEFDASRRARIMLQETGIVTREEDATVGKVLSAAALTYVAATLSAILNLAYYVLLALSVLGGGRRDERY
jgi:Zn-dependent membrane protease YugP